MGAGASVPDKIDLETAKTLAGDKFDEAKFNALAVDGFVAKDAALKEMGVPPEILATVWGGEAINEEKIAALGATLAEGAFAEFVGEHAMKAPDGSVMKIPGEKLTAVMGMLKGGFSNFTFNAEKKPFVQQADGAWAADILVKGTHDGSFTPMPGMLPPVEASGKEVTIGPSWLLCQRGRRDPGSSSRS